MKTTSELKVELIETMGTDRSIAEAAWVSTARAESRPMPEVHRILRYLAKHKHWTPFGQTALKFRFHIPIFVARQLMRSNVGIVWNEESRRYVDEEPVFYVPIEWRSKSASLKQGSDGPLQDQAGPDLDYKAALFACKYAYDRLLERGVAPEMARMVLPVNAYTTLIGTFNLASAARVVSLRIHPHAQWEIQQVAKKMDEVIRGTPMGFAWEQLIANQGETNGQ